MQSTSANRQSGAVSLFVVIIAMLLISVVTIGFLRLMLNNQQQATNSDLAQSALDSAQAGVEDAKRALLKCVKAGPGCDVSKFAQCNAALADVVDSGSVAPGKDSSSVGEIKIQQTTSSTDDTVLQQAYTCVTVQLNTDDYVDNMSPNASKLIPLVGVGGSFNTVTVEWFSLDDIGTGGTALDAGVSGSQPLEDDWPINRPPVLRTQLMQMSDNFTLDSFDATSSGQSNANTVFLYPQLRAGGIASTPLTPINLIDRDVRADGAGKDPIPDTSNDSPLPIQCRNNLASGGYACSASLRLPEPIGGTAATRTAYLRLTSFYNSTHFRVTLSNDNVPVQFNAVQPAVDSTGRANDLFRRVQSRVNMYDTSFPYPEAAVDVTGNFCKDFSVTDTQYIAGACTP